MGLKFEVVVSSFDETLPKDEYSAAEYAKSTAAHKALDVARVLAAQAAAAAAAGDAAAAAGGPGAAAAAAAAQQQQPALVIGADTVVEYREHILEKPADAAEAAAVLRMLSGQRHHVHTGVALVLPPVEGSTGKKP
ncbi:N-acetylserotonin O-methyltransferase isoform B [Micractinium conductrix]|uniref:N-acetylserotonin O-methyltransferase isoform B n=1 Tax=Micractinium conductrix TaxID=554055 RepID=A0A2P6VPR6_9CHLO|nr:N-acetylserotonin O-methyltransferase isoform B [Micractinium conductrix]|eukprot:PSC76098.1 N-acetylserotonin O-methyltransferase isoform B [Micractinium conductrix]